MPDLRLALLVAAVGVGLARRLRGEADRLLRPGSLAALEAAIDSAAWEEYERQKRASADYAQVWWRSDPAAIERCGREVGLQRELELLEFVTTADVYEDDEWADERQRLHEEIVGQVPLTSRRAGGPRQAYLLAGPPGAGKSSVLRQMVERHRTSKGLESEPIITVSSDDVRERLPEYAAGLGSTVVHEEASHIAYRLLYPRARASGADLVIDSIGRSVYVRTWADHLSADGFEVHLLAVHVDPSEAVQRMRSRALETGRTVPTDVVVEAASATTDLVELASRESWPVTSMVLVDNMVDRGAAPRVMTGTPPWGAAGQPVALW